jgi:hypothetical protein
MFHLLLVPCIVWHIGPIFLYKPFQTYLWFFALKIYYNICMVISIIAPKGIWSLPNYQKSWKRRATKFCETLKQDESH